VVAGPLHRHGRDRAGRGLRLLELEVTEVRAERELHRGSVGLRDDDVVIAAARVRREPPPDPKAYRGRRAGGVGAQLERAPEGDARDLAPRDHAVRERHLLRRDREHQPVRSDRAQARRARMPRPRNTSVKVTPAPVTGSPSTSGFSTPSHRKSTPKAPGISETSTMPRSAFRARAACAGVACRRITSTAMLRSY